MTDERVWLQHGEHGQFFHCPAAAVEAWKTLGWQVSDSGPDEYNPVTAELVAAQQAAAAERAAAEERAAEEARATKSSRKGGTAETTQEG